MDDVRVDAYLRRIGVPRPTVLDAAALKTLHRAHLVAVPFENLSIHLGEQISLDADALFDKIVTRRRGGFCYELNGSFAMLLGALGASVAMLSAKVYGPRGLGPPFDHLALLVDIGDGVSRLCDVGFGNHSTYPLAFDERGDQSDPGGVFRILDVDNGDVNVVRDASPQYRAERRHRDLSEFGPTCWWQQTSPDSHFTQSTICSRLTEDGRVSISGRQVIRTEDGVRKLRTIEDDDALLEAYRDLFGVELDRVPIVASPERTRRPSSVSA